jgi:hypothetical protein
MRPVIHSGARSPYRRYGKTPHLYSPLLLELLKARRDGLHERADSLAMRHSRSYSLRAFVIHEAEVNVPEGVEEL